MTGVSFILGVIYIFCCNDDVCILGEFNKLLVSAGGEAFCSGVLGTFIFVIIGAIALLFNEISFNGLLFK